MWKCPKCGREFKNVGQGHYCKDKPKTIDEYILFQDGIVNICAVFKPTKLCSFS